MPIPLPVIYAIMLHEQQYGTQNFLPFVSLCLRVFVLQIHTLVVYKPMLSPEIIALMTAVFLASVVEAVEAFTIVLAMGLTRNWRATIIGTLAALVTLAVVTTGIGFTLSRLTASILSSTESLLQFIVGLLLLIFGLQWLRKAILRATGLQAIHDEEKIFQRQQEAARNAGTGQKFGLDWFAFVISYKGVFLEGMEVVFIVITFGLQAQKSRTPHAMLIAAASAILAVLLVAIAGAFAHKPLSMVPENTMKFAVALLLSTFGLFWGVEGLGHFSAGQTSLEWPTGDWALLWVLAAWVVVSWVTVAVLKPLVHRGAPAQTPAGTGGKS